MNRKVGVLILIVLAVLTVFVLQFRTGKVVTYFPEEFVVGDEFVAGLKINIERGDSIHESAPVEIAIVRKGVELVSEIIRFEDFVKLFAENTSVKIQKISLESAYDEAKRNPRSVYGLESLNILVGDYTSDGKQLKKLSNVKLTTIAEFLQSSRLS